MDATPAVAVDEYSRLASPAAAAEARLSRRPLFMQRRSLPMWIAFCLGVFADNMLRQALIIGVSFGAVSAPAFLGGDDSVPVIGSLFAVAMLTCSSIAGQFADKVETRTLFRRTKLAEVAIMASAAIAFLLDSGLLLILSLFAMGAQSAFFSPARISAMSKYFSVPELVRANGLYNAGLYVSIILGLFVGGVLIERPGGATLVAGVLLVAAALGWVAVRGAPPARADAPELKIDWGAGRQALTLFRFVVEAPGVIRPLAGLAAFYFMTTLVTVLVPLYARDALGAGPMVANVMMIAFALGAGGGALLASALARGSTGLSVAALGVAGSAGATGLACLLTPLAASAGSETVAALFSNPAGVALFSAFAASSLLLGLFVVPLQAAIQRRAPPERRARIMAASNMANAAAAMLGSLSVLAVTTLNLDPALGLLVIGAMQAAVALEMERRRRTAPAGLYDDATVSAAATDPN